MRNSSDPDTMMSAPVEAPTARQNSVARASSLRFCVGSLTSGGVSMTSSLVFLSTCFLRNRWNSPWRSTFWSLLSRAFSASVTRMNGASASFSLPRRGRRGFRGSRSLTWLTPAETGGAQRSAATATAEATSARRTGRTRRCPIGIGLGPTGGFPRRARVGGVELGEAGVVAADVVVVGPELQRLLVFLQRPRELARRLQRNREVVVRAGVGGVLRDRLLEAELGLPPESLLGDLGAERDLGVRLLGVRVGGAAGHDKEKSDGRRRPPHSYAPCPNPRGSLL